MNSTREQVCLVDDLIKFTTSEAHQRDGRDQLMTAIQSAAYGKAGVHVLTRVTVDGLACVRDVSMSISITGDFLDSYRAGDNQAVLPSDTLRRHAIAAVDAARVDSDMKADVLPMLNAIARRIIIANTAITRVSIDASVTPWQRWSPTSFVRAPWTETAMVHVDNDGSVTSRCGVIGLDVLTTAGSSFTGFMHDSLTVQTDAHDRPLLGTLEASWTFVDDAESVLTADVVASLLDAVSERPSNGVQQLLHDSAIALLDGHDSIGTLTLRFASTSLPPIPSDLAANGVPMTHQVGDGSVGITEVTLARD